jgi:hypothetical protein
LRLSFLVVVVPRRMKSVVAEAASNDQIMHDGADSLQCFGTHDRHHDLNNAG